MPYTQPGNRHLATFTKVTQHGDPCVEENHVGFAAKVAQMGPYADPTLAAAKQIAVGEQGNIMMDGIHFVRQAVLPGGNLAGTAVGQMLMIASANNAITSGVPTTAPGAGILRLGLVDRLDATRGGAYVNMDRRGDF
jgi:hypothetical protein